MDEQKLSDNDTSKIIKAFEIETKEENLTEEELLQVLCDQIAYMIEFRMEYLLSLLYRNDIAESKINLALLPNNPDPANVALAKLVLQRQKQRMATKKSIAVEPIEDLEDGLRWGN